MAMVHDSKFSFHGQHTGPGQRKGHNHFVQSQIAIPRTQSLPQLGIPAGHSQTLGNRLPIEHYASLRGPFHARLNAPFPENGGRREDNPVPRERAAEEWTQPERIRPETLPPAGRMKHRIQGKRLVQDNTNTLSHVDTLIWGADYDGSDGLLKQVDSPLYYGSAGVNAKAERTPIFGHLPPTCRRTFGEEVCDDTSDKAWESKRFERHDPRRDYVD